jgi:hypothetical protein
MHANRLMQIAWIAVLSVALVAGTVVLIWRNQERILFQPPAPPHRRSQARHAEITAADGQRLFALVVGEFHAAVPKAVLAFHGNAAIAAWRVPWAAEVARRTGCVVVLAEYRGYAGLDGEPSYATTQIDAHAAYAFVQSQWALSPERIVLFGHSLGSAVAAELAASDGCAALVLEAPFTSARDMARVFIARATHIVWRLVSRIHFDTERLVQSLETPVWVAHGTHDPVVPMRMGEQVFRSARHHGEFLLVDGAGHNDIPDRGGETYWRWIGRAIDHIGAK